MKYNCRFLQFLSLGLLVSLPAAVHAQEELDPVLRTIGCNLYADFIKKYPPEGSIGRPPSESRSIYCSNDDAMNVFYAEHPEIRARVYAPAGARMAKRDDTDIEAQSQSNQNEVLNPIPPNKGWKDPPGAVEVSGKAESPGDVLINQGIPASKPKFKSIKGRAPVTVPVAQVFSGSGSISGVLDSWVPFKGGYIHVVNKQFTLAKDFIASIGRGAGLTSFQTALSRVPSLRDELQKAPRITVFVPDDGAFVKAGNVLASYSDSDWEKLINYHSISNGFIGYGPTLQDKKSYTTRSGHKIVVNWIGDELWVNNAKVVGRDHIMSNGVVQVIDTILIPPSGGEEVPGPDGKKLKPGPDSTIVDPFNANPGLTDGYGVGDIDGKRGGNDTMGPPGPTPIPSPGLGSNVSVRWAPIISALTFSVLIGSRFL